MKERLPRKIGLLSAIAVLVGSTIGSGIFRSPASIAGKLPEESSYLLLWALAGFLTLCGSLTYAELACALPRTGGVLVYIKEGFGRLPAFLFGWAELLLIRASALGAIATVFAEYFLRLLGFSIQGQSEVRYVAAIAILAVALINIVGIRAGAAVQNFTAAVKYSALLILVLAAFLIGPRQPAALQAEPVPNGISPAAFGLALISALWVYDGWADVTFVSGEVQKPTRNLPLAIIAGTLAVITIYLMANLAYIHLLDMSQVASSKLVAADAAYRLIGQAGVAVVSFAVMISTFGTLNGSMMTGPRIFFAMADEGLFFKKLASVHPRFKTPHVAIALAAALAIAFVMVQRFEQLADTFVLAIWPFYALGVAAIYPIRRKRLGSEYRTWGYPLTPALFVAAAMLVLGNALIEDAKNALRLLSGESAPSGTGGTLLVFAVIIIGIPIYRLWDRWPRR